MILKHVISMSVLQNKSKLCQPRAANSIIKWYHANFMFLLGSNLSVKPYYLKWGFETFRSWYWLYLGTVDSFLSVSDISTSNLMFSCIFHGKTERGLCCLIIQTFHVEISQNLYLNFWHMTFREPRIFLGAKICPGLWKYYV